MVNQRVVALHAEEAGFLWASRDRAVADPTYSLRSLAALDSRLEAHLDGLRTAGDAGWSLCRAQLESGDAGPIFPLAVLAFEIDDRQRMLDALTIGSVSTENRRALISAMGWLDYRVVEAAVQSLLRAKAPIHRAVGVAVCAVHRRNPGAVLTAAVDDADPILRARALRAAGELKRVDLANRVRMHLDDDDLACRFWAAWTLSIHGEREGLGRLTQWLGHGDRFGRTALQLSLRAMTLEDGRDWVRVFAKDPDRRRSAVVGAGTLGDPTSVPWLIGQMDSPELSKLAGESFSMITGVDLERQGLDRPPSADADESEQPAAGDNSVEADYDGHLPWPRADLIDQWWQAHKSRFSDGTRHLAGQPLTTDTARRVLVSGKQRQRVAAAIEIALREPDEVLFEVRGRAAAQRRQLDRAAAR